MYSIDELTSEFGISRHTIYGWRKKGVLPPPVGGRRFAQYTQEHYRIIKAIRMLVHDQRVTLADLAERLHGGKDDA
jgi:DNA-binding transcriptional MerR regulator